MKEGLCEGRGKVTPEDEKHFCVIPFLARGFEYRPEC
jgi:hypothetical protein